MSGKPNREKECNFSATVAMSSLLFLLVAIPFHQTDNYLWVSIWGLVSFLSLLADSVIRWNKFVNTADRVFASSIFLAFPVRLIVWPGPASWDFRLAAFFMLMGCSCVLLWARNANGHSEFVVRQSLWHLTSVMALYYVAYKECHGYNDSWHSGLFY